MSGGARRDAGPEVVAGAGNDLETPTVHGPVARRHLLVAFPHPDDESFATGGTIAMHADAGVPVTYLCGTHGDMGRNMGVPFFANRETLRDVREAELRDACRILGCEPRLMGLRDKTVEFEDPDVLAERIAQTIRDTHADLVVTFFPGRAVHPDHDAMGEAVVRAVRSLPAQDRPTLWAVAVGDRDALDAELGPADVVVDVRAFGDRKMRALQAHASQTTATFARMAADGEGAEALRTQFERSRTIERFRTLHVDAGGIASGDAS
ncbi:MAG: bacillithiol biosynthesis deacetylase BshB2 [Trueperaceae bacterium]